MTFKKPLFSHPSSIQRRTSVLFSSVDMTRLSSLQEVRRWRPAETHRQEIIGIGQVQTLVSKVP
jgi:hypothetical protein